MKNKRFRVRNCFNAIMLIVSIILAIVMLNGHQKNPTMAI